MPRLAIFLLFALPTVAVAGPTDDVLRMVPASATVCVVAQDLRGTAERIAASPFAEFFAASKFGKSLLASDALAQLTAAEKTLSEHLGVSFADLRADVFGDAVAYAYLPADDAGVFIGRAGKPATLATLVEKLNAAQTKSGELKAVTEKKYGGIAYSEREKSDGRKEYYLVRENGAFAYSTSEAAVKGVIDRLAATKKSEPGPFEGMIDKLGAKDATAVLLFEPKAMAADLLAAERAATDPNQKAFLKQFGKVWGSVDAAAVSLSFDKDATLAVTFAVQPDKLPPELAPLFKPHAKGGSLWSVIPDDALVVFAGRFEWDKFTSLVGSFLSDDANAGLKKLADEVIAPVVGKGTLPKLKKNLGPDWGLWLTAPPKDGKGVLPTLTVVLRVRPAGGKDGVGEAVAGGVEYAVQFFRVAYNRTHDDQFTVHDEKTADGVVKYLKNDAALPPEVRPAWGVRGDFFVFGSSVEAVTGFTPPKSDAAVKDAPLVRVNAGKVAAYLNGRAGELADALAAWTGETPDKLKADLQDFASFLELFDTLELHHTGDGKTMSVSVRMKTAKPLRK